jgi:hypothetical protein
MDSIFSHACRLVDNFDFIKVQKMMAAVNWKWGGPYMNGELGLPTIDAMQSQAMALILEAGRLDCNCSAGGLEAYWVRKGQVAGYTGNGYIGLRFIGAERYEY